MARWLEVLWREDSSGPWLCVADWYCASCVNGLTGFMASLGTVQLVFEGM